MLILLLLLELFKVVNLNKYIMSERKQRQKSWARGYISREMAKARNAKNVSADTKKRVIYNAHSFL